MKTARWMVVVVENKHVSVNNYTGNQNPMGAVISNVIFHTFPFLPCLLPLLSPIHRVHRLTLRE
jgi:hypothetical protein